MLELTKHQQDLHNEIKDKPVLFWTPEQGIGKHLILMSLMQLHTQPLYVCGAHMVSFMVGQIEKYNVPATICTPYTLPEIRPNFLIVDMPGVSRSELQINSILSMLALSLVVEGDPILFIN